MRDLRRRVPFIRPIAAFATVLVWAAGSAMALQAAGAAPSEATPQGAKEQAPSPYLRVTETDAGTKVSLEVGIRTLRPAPGSPGPEVSLVGAVHIADGSFYDEVQRFLDGRDLVLFEAVKPAGSGEAGADADEDTKVAQTEGRLRLMAMMIARYQRSHDRLPASLDELVAGLSPELARAAAGADEDAWGRRLVYVLDPGVASPVAGTAPMPPAGYDLLSYGADGAAGGDGPAADRRFADQKPLTRAESGSAGEKPGLQQKMADALGLVFQLQGVDYARPNWRNSDLSIDQIQTRLDEAGASGDALFGMLDGRSFSAKLAGLVLGIVGSNPTFAAMGKVMMVEMLSGAEELMGAMPGQMGKLFDVIIKDRNQVVVDDLRRIIADEPEVGTVGIFYGAGHLPDLEERLVEQLGYEPGETEWVSAIQVDLTAAGIPPAQARQLRQMVRTTIERQRPKPPKR